MSRRVKKAIFCTDKTNQSTAFSPNWTQCHYKRFTGHKQNLVQRENNPSVVVIANQID